MAMTPEVLVEASPREVAPGHVHSDSALSITEDTPSVRRGDGNQVGVSPRVTGSAPAAPSHHDWVRSVAASAAVVISVAALIQSNVTTGIQEKRLAEQIKVQQEAATEQKEQDEFKRFSDLLPRIGCVATTDRQLALEALRISAPTWLRLALSVIEKCPNQSAGTLQKLKILRQEASDNEFVSAFVSRVDNGRQYLVNGLHGSAARTFDAAADMVPRSYIVKHVVDLEELAVAREAYFGRRFSEAADLFAKAYRKVPVGATAP